MIRPEFWAGRRVLVTGHTGFKGSWLSLWLASLGARVTGYALQPPSTPSLWQFIDGTAGITSMHADVRDADRLDSAFAATRPEIVFHLAAQSLVRASYEDPVRTYATNVMGTVNVLDAARRTPGVLAMVSVTSDKCYENLEHGRSYREGDPMGGSDPYSSSKGCAELVTAAYRKSFFDTARGQAAVASARAGNVIGGGDWATDRIVPDTVRAVIRGEDVQVRHPQAVRPWQHVLEPLAGYLLLAQRLCETPTAFAEGWNFGPAEKDAAPVAAVVTGILRAWQARSGWTHSAGIQPPEAGVLRLDNSKACSRLGWLPRLDLESALQWTVEWYKAHSEGKGARELSMAQIDRYMRLGG